MDFYKDCLTKRGENSEFLKDILEMNKTRKQLIRDIDFKKETQNKTDKKLLQLKKEKKDVKKIIEELKELKRSIKEQKEELSKWEEKIQEKVSTLPNYLLPSTPVGKDEKENKLIRKEGVVKQLPFSPKSHIEIGKNLGILDFSRASKVSGARFVALFREGALLERALIQFMMDVHSKEHGYEETIPPYVVNEQSLFGTGQFPKFYEDVFHLENTNYHLIPTAEVPVTNYYSGEILKALDLPKKFVAFSPCFRSEAGSYGQDTKGMIRQHQFHKVELVKFCHPETSEQEHESLTRDAEKILTLLELPYRVMSLCSGDLGFAAAKCYDIEVWLPGEGKYREISSCSNFLSFQAQRANIRFYPKQGAKPEFVHTLNGSGLAVGRTLIAILENYQQKDGSVSVPKVLQAYMNGLERITPGP